MGGKASAASKNAWNAKTYDRINLMVPKGQKEEMKAQAQAHNMSLNAYIISLIQKGMKEG